MQLFKIKIETGWVLLKLLVSVLVAGIILFGASFFPIGDPIGKKESSIFWGILMIASTFGVYQFMPIGKEFFKKE